MRATHYLVIHAFGRPIGTRCCMSNVGGVDVVMFFDEPGKIEAFQVTDAERHLIKKEPDAWCGDVFQRCKDPSKVWVCTSCDEKTGTATVKLIGERLR